VLVAVVVYLSLANIAIPQVPSSIGDKINHLIAYSALMGWFGQLLIEWRHRMLAAVALVLLGITMEYCQGLTAYRVFEWQDALANSMGVVLGFIALSLGADRILVWFESRYIRVR